MQAKVSGSILSAFLTSREHVSPHASRNCTRHVESLTLEFLAGPAGDRIRAAPEGRKNVNTCTELNA